MIPKTIHYCWFGRNPLPESALKCIASWKKFFPDYEIIEWNEDNFDVNCIPYTAQAYEAKKYAFVSDYARFRIIYEHGGLYFDTDVEVIRPMDDIIERGAFLGFEVNPCPARPYGAVAAGLGMGAEPDMSLYKTILDYYQKLDFILPDGSFNTTDAVVNITTRELIKAGMKDEPGIQRVADNYIYPSDWFNPFDDATGRLNKTANTRTIHWFTKTWLNVSPWRQRLSRLAHRMFGTGVFVKLRKLLRK
ncbi:MAG: glycosyl transferase [Muribaculaceae bacterium]|nr:glycosyl transferase [Muribaculaceae bacterium]